MDEILSFGTIVLVVAGGFLLALAVIKLTERFPIPSPALFLLIGALISVPEVYHHLSLKTAERIGVVALVLILFDGGMHVGWNRFRRALVPIATLGIVGTFATAAVVAVAGHYLFDFQWTTAWILGAAVAPTDPAVMFSVLGNREVGGRSGTILEGESGANDPVGIALMIAILDYATKEHASLWSGVADFAISMTVGLAIGVIGALVLMKLMRSVSLPGEGLYPIRTLVFAFVIYGVATLAHGSGFLAVFVAGLLISEVRAPFKGEIENFHKSLASLGEIAVFAVLGLTLHLSDLGPTSVWLDGLLIALLLAFVSGRSSSPRSSRPSGSGSERGSSSRGEASRAPCRSSWGSSSCSKGRAARPACTGSSSSWSRSRSSSRGQRCRTWRGASACPCAPSCRRRGTSRSA